MSVVALQCPHCSTRLRVRDQTFIGRTIHCPECAEKVQIVRDADGVVVGRVPEPSEVPQNVSETPQREAVRGPTSSSTGTGTLSPVNGQTFWTPVRFAWGLAVSGAVIAWVWVMLSPGNAPPRDVAGPADADDAPIAAAPAPDRVEPDAVPPGPDQPAPEPGDDPSPEAAQRLKAAAGWVTEYRDRQGVFPAEQRRAAEVNEAERLGWIAEVVAEREPAGPQPLWDRPLDDPLNGRFVRRRMPELLLPDIRELAADGLPATHVIGVAGAGADAARLPTRHPRAGIFGIGRATRPEDVRDGLGNTILLVGLERGFAPWAGGGGGTIRGFTAEPYIRGPDGFGTGQPNGMYVAMADGSVRFLSVDTAPVIVRRMAAMADGLPLDPAVPGEPGATPAPPEVARPMPPPGAAEPKAPPPQAVADAMSDVPIEPQLARDPVVVPKPSYNVDRALQQPIRRFSQVRPVPFLDLVHQVEELAGIPVDLSGVAAGPMADRLQREVRLELSDTTVGAILTALVEQVNLTYETGSEFGIRLKGPEL